MPTVRWVYVMYNVRCILVGKKLKRKTWEASLASYLFSEMPPWETVKSLLSFLVMDGISDRGELLEICTFDIFRAVFFTPSSDREWNMGLLDEAKEPGDGVDVARLNRSMYGFRDASNNWMRDWQNLLESEGDAVGKANLVLSFNNQRNLLADRNALLAHWQSVGIKMQSSREPSTWFW